VGGKLQGGSVEGRKKKGRREEKIHRESHGLGETVVGPRQLAKKSSTKKQKKTGELKEALPEGGNYDEVKRVVPVTATIGSQKCWGKETCGGRGKPRKSDHWVKGRGKKLEKQKHVRGGVRKEQAKAERS